MRRIVLALLLVALSLGASSAIAVPTHAQIASPTVAVVPSTVVAGNTVTVEGAGFTHDYYVFVYWQRPDGTTNGTWVISDSTGAFAMTLGFLASHGTGTEYVAAYDYATGRWAPFASVLVTNGAPPPPT